MKPVYLHDRQTDHNLVALMIPDMRLMIVIHEDTMAVFEVRDTSDTGAGARYTEAVCPWDEAELRRKMLEWSERVNHKITLGINAWFERQYAAMAPSDT